MHALTSNCTILQQYTEVSFLLAGGVKPTDIKWEILAQYGSVNLGISE
jgi:hypothetical protein